MSARHRLSLPMLPPVALLLPAALLLVVAVPAAAQVVGNQDASLQGVQAVDAQIAVTWRDAITKDGGPTETLYEQELQSALNQTLEGAGLQISTSVPNYLYCTAVFVYNEEAGLVSAAQTVEYHVPVEGEQWGILWTQLRVYAVGLDNFEGTDDGQWCANEFADAWRSANAGG